MKCLNPSCERSALYRGLCATCYQAARRLVANKLTTWTILESEGRALKILHERKGITNWLLTGNAQKANP